MTIEQKAKAYDAIVNKIETIYQTSDVVLIKDVFPELESEDERIKKVIKEAINSYWADDIQAREDCIAWLEKQKNIISDYEDKLDKCACDNFNKGFQAGKEYQKPAEWSEEDEKILNGLIDSVEHNCYLTVKELGWLKSLKPQNHWKPSEEQMNALKWAKSEYHPDCPQTKVALNYLYEELKKL